MSENLIVGSIMFPHQRQHSSIIDIQSYRVANCDIDHYLVVVQVRRRTSVNKQAAQKFDMDRFNFKKLNDVEVTEHWLKSETSLQHWNTSMIMWTLVGLEKVLEYKT
jgi:hypothetical protein